ncbi:hypothetical protein EJB05_36196, partial [Eragrostis curvula]
MRKRDGGRPGKLILHLRHRRHRLDKHAGAGNQPIRSHCFRSSDLHPHWSTAGMETHTDEVEEDQRDKTPPKLRLLHQIAPLGEPTTSPTARPAIPISSAA